MMQGYEITKHGIIHEIDGKPRKYNTEYIDDRYNKYGEQSRWLSWMRLGWILANVKNCDSILDVGYGNGDFLQAAKQYFDRCGGSEVNGYTIPSGCVKVENILSNHYDIITFFDTLEHFENIDFVKNLKCKYIVVSFPNCHSSHDIEWFMNWKHRRPGEHLWHFDLQTLAHFMLSCGFVIVNHSDFENSIRKSDDPNNILTAIFRKYE